MNPIPQNTEFKSPLLLFCPEYKLQDLLGTYLLFPPELDAVRSVMGRYLISPTEEWLVFTLFPEIRYQTLFLKFLEEYKGKVALFSSTSLAVLETVQSRVVAFHSEMQLKKYRAGPGIRVEQMDVTGIKNPFTLKGFLLAPYLSNSRKRILSILDMF